MLQTHIHSRSRHQLRTILHTICGISSNLQLDSFMRCDLYADQSCPQHQVARICVTKLVRLAQNTKHIEIVFFCVCVCVLFFSYHCGMFPWTSEHWIISFLHVCSYISRCVGGIIQCSLCRKFTLCILLIPSNSNLTATTLYKYLNSISIVCTFFIRLFSLFDDGFGILTPSKSDLCYISLVWMFFQLLIFFSFFRLFICFLRTKIANP